MLGPSFSRSVSSHAGNSTVFTGLLAGTYSVDSVRSSDGSVRHGQFVLAEGGTQAIIVGLSALTVPAPGVASTVATPTTTTTTAAVASTAGAVTFPITNPTTNPNDRAFMVPAVLGSVTITNPTDREFSITMLGPSFSRSVSSHAGNSTVFTGLLAGTYSVDSVRLSDGSVRHGQFVLAAGGTQPIIVGLSVLTIR